MVLDWWTFQTGTPGKEYGRKNSKSDRFKCSLV